ncbi:MAG: hypothetical protein K6G10_04065 [Butyrivibrio sp.]|nr:hypothetical protein [Butyrivibrio sp.]
MIRKKLIKSLSVIMATMLAVMTVACGSNKQTEVADNTLQVAQEQQLEASMVKTLPIASTESDAGKVETVYVTANANGTVNDVIVSEWLKNAEASAQISDTTELKNIVNVKGSETYTENADGTLTWDAEGADIYYQGTTDKELPVNMNITYTLDGKEIAPEDLAGKSGHVSIKFEYENNAKQTVEVKGKDIEVYTPFAMVSGMMLDSDKFANVEISRGKVISDGGNYIVMGVAVPGLKESLDITEEQWDKLDDSDEIKDQLSNSFEITADTSDFEMGMTVTMASSDLLSDFGMSDLSDSEKIEDLRDDMEELNDGANKLVDGSQELKDGTGKLRDGVSELYDGTGKLKDGTSKLYDGTGSLKDGTQSLYEGTGSLKDGIGTYTDGVAKVNDGAAKLAKGAADAKAGSAKLTGAMKKAGMVEGASNLASGIETLEGSMESIKKLASGVSSLASATNKLSQQKAACDAALAWLQNTSDTTTAPNDLELAGLNAGKEPANYTIDAATALKVKKAGIAALSGDETTYLYMIQNHEELVTEVQQGVLYASAEDEENIGNEHEEIDEQLGDDTETESGDNSGSGDDTETGSGDNSGSGDDTETGSGDENDDNQGGSSEEAGNGEDVENPDVTDEDQEPEEEIIEEDVDVTGNARKEVLVGDSTDTTKFDAGNIKMFSGYAQAYGKLLGAMESASQTLGTVLAMMSNMGEVPSEAQITAMMKQLDDGLAQLDTGSKALANGVGQVYDGAVALDKGLGDLEKGTKDLYAGTSKLADNNGKLNDGAQQLNEGAGKLNDGAQELKDGAKDLDNGAGELNDGVKELNDGAIKLDDGVQELLDGMVKFDNEGIKKIYDAFDGDLTDFADRLQAIQKAGTNYKTFGGSSDDIDSSVKFVIKTDGIKTSDI